MGNHATAVNLRDLPRPARDRRQSRELLPLRLNSSRARSRVHGGATMSDHDGHGPSPGRILSAFAQKLHSHRRTVLHRLSAGHWMTRPASAGGLIFWNAPPLLGRPGPSNRPSSQPAGTGRPCVQRRTTTRRQRAQALTTPLISRQTVLEGSLTIRRWISRNRLLCRVSSVTPSTSSVADRCVVTLTASRCSTGVWCPQGRLRSRAEKISTEGADRGQCSATSDVCDQWELGFRSLARPRPAYDQPRKPITV